jgi:PAS domain S-box-containing protein
VMRTVAGLVVASAVLIAGGLLLAFVMGDRIRIGLQTAELKEAYQMARASEQRVRTIIEAAQDPFIAVDLRGRIIDWNGSAELAFGWSRDEILGQRVAETLLPTRFAGTLDPALQDFLSTGTSVAVGQTVERLLVDRHGHERTFEVKIGFVDTGEQRFFAAFLHDISRRKEVERLKAEFVSTVSHELRTPLTAIYGSLGLLSSGAAGALPTAASELTRLSYQSCERLVRLVNDILDVEKFASGRADYVFRMQSVRSMVEQAITDTQPFADGFGVQLKLVPGPDLDVRADRDRIVQVAVNLLSNAAKFSPRGSLVDVTVDVLEDRVRVTVGDRGAGVPEEFRGRMFERFAQADASDRRLKGGTGLGLNICRSIMTAHGGRIDFTSEPNVRTEFFFELPRPGSDSAAG